MEFARLCLSCSDWYARSLNVQGGAQDQSPCFIRWLRASKFYYWQLVHNCWLRLSNFWDCESLPTYQPQAALPIGASPVDGRSAMLYPKPFVPSPLFVVFGVFVLGLYF